MDTTTTTYRFGFDDGTLQEFSVDLALPSLRMIPPADEEEPAWTALEFHRCPNCPKAMTGRPQCPVARNLAPACRAFSHRVSHDVVDVEVQTEHRRYAKTCSVQEAFSSLMGLIMATSGCPRLDPLRPMVLTHLPFATTEQSTFRAVSTYLVAQYVRRQHGMEPDWSLAELIRLYEEIRRVNLAFAERLRSMQKSDANINAMVRLDTMADLTTFAVSRRCWEPLAPLFESYLTEQGAEKGEALAVGGRRGGG